MRSRVGGVGVCLALAAGALGGCGGGDGDSSPPRSDNAAPPAVPACAKAGSTIPRPPDLPADFPLPPGTVITSSQNPHPGQLLIGGVIPADLRGAAVFFSDELPARGYELGLGDSEQGEAEAPFSGHGLRGKWKVNGILNCPSAVTLTLVLIDQT
jgi:hypothetical protein